MPCHFLLLWLLSPCLAPKWTQTCNTLHFVWQALKCSTPWVHIQIGSCTTAQGIPMSQCTRRFQPSHLNNVQCVPTIPCASHHVEQNVCPTDACPKELGTPTMNYGVAPTNKGIIAQGTREPRNIMFIIQATLRLLWETPNDNTHLATILTQIALPSYSMSCKNAQGMLVQTCNVSWKQTNAYQ